MKRRTVLLGGGALIVSAFAGGTLGVAMLDRNGFLAAVLRRYLPDAVVPESELVEFAQSYWPLMEKQYSSRVALMRALNAADRLLIPGELDSTELLERDILTNFLIGSNFFNLKDPKTEPIDFTGLSIACSNPFRRV
jgi:hypothetical protein